MRGFTKLIIFHILLISILIFLIVKVQIREDDFHCKNCQIKFVNKIGYDSESIHETVIYENITRMYEAYLEDGCSIEWIQGGYTGGILNQNE